VTAASEHLRRGWCPGALRPMPSGDGLIVRLKPSCGTLTLDQAEAIAALAAQYGNGMIELTSRGNVQLRGVRDDTLAPLIGALDGLGLLDDSASAEGVRNVIGSPLAGLDASTFDTRALARGLEERLRSDTSLHALSDKFLYVIDGGGVLPLDDVEADVRFALRDDGFAIGLGRELGCAWIGACAADDVVTVAAALASAFIAEAHGARRMRLLDDAALDRVVAAIPSARRHGERVRVRRRIPATIDGAGVVPPSQRLFQNLPLTPTLSPSRAETGRGSAVAIGLAYGATTATALATLLGAVREAGAREIRLTPWRAIIIPVASEQDATALAGAASRLGFVTDAGDPRRAIAACPGAPACGNGSTPVREDADRFAAVADGLVGEGEAGFSLHVSGCSKGCARRQRSAITLVAGEGRYGVVVNGAAGDGPRGHYTGEEAAELLARLALAVKKAETNDGSRARALAAALKEIEAA
jgi:precorrin-3B synthase